MGRPRKNPLATTTKIKKKKGRKPLVKTCYLCDRELKRMKDDPTRFDATYSGWTKRYYCPVLEDETCKILYAERKAAGVFDEEIAVDLAKKDRSRERIIGKRRVSRK